MSRFGLKTGIDFEYFGLKLGMSEVGYRFFAILALKGGNFKGQV